VLLGYLHWGVVPLNTTDGKQKPVKELPIRYIKYLFICVTDWGVFPTTLENIRIALNPSIFSAKKFPLFFNGYLTLLHDFCQV
jgi:hypothetical protein